ncbi:MAG: DUF2970 domain-containing protein [Gammaproteobacteria bacterium]|nr:DUF2970 domain-containing protein [Gammaproteobacteria bacterium]
MSKDQSENRSVQGRGQGQGQSLGRVFASVLASMFGVRSGRNREQDFTQGRPWIYVVVGLVVTVVFVLTVWTVVRMVLKSAGV